MRTNIRTRAKEGTLHIIYGIVSLFIAAVDGGALVLHVTLTGVEERWRNQVWPFLKEKGPQVARSAVNVSLVSINVVNIALAAALGKIRNQV